MKHAENRRDTLAVCPICIRLRNALERSAKTSAANFLQKPGLSQADQEGEAAGINPAPAKNRFA